MIRTHTDPSAAYARLYDDDVIQLRVWGDERAWRLAAEPEWRIGSAATCTLRLADAHGYISRQHASLTREQHAWMLRDTASKNGVRVDGARRLACPLSPGAEIGIGGVRLVAESERSIALRAYLQRLLGWTPDRAPDVDDALRRLRLHALRREPLLLVGEGDLIAIAHSLHRRTAGDAPFVACGPRRDALDAAHEAAADGAGTLCVWERRPPRGFAQLRARLGDPRLGLRMILCAHAIDPLDALASHPIQLPRLAERPAADLDRIIREAAADACAQLALDPTAFTADDHEWVRRHARRTHAELERATLRRAALASTGGSITRAAVRLGISHVALSRWLARRRTMVR